MTSSTPLSFAVLALLSVVAASPAAAQREMVSADFALTVEAARRPSPSLAGDAALSVDAELVPGEALVLRAPSAGDYVAPVLGVVFGSLLTLGGAGTVLVGGLVWLVQASFDSNTDGSELALGLGAAGLAVGLVCVIAGGVALGDLRNRARAAEHARRAPTLVVAPIDSGAMFVVGGAY